MSFRYCATKRPTAEGSAAVIHLEFYGNPFLMVANPSLRFLHAEERERGVVRPVVGLAKPAQMREAGVADVVVDLVFEPRAPAEDKPAVSVQNQILPSCSAAKLKGRTCG